MKLLQLTVLLFCVSLFASETIVVDSTGSDFQNYWYTGTFGQQIVVDDSGNVHVCYNKTWCTETDTGRQVMYANVTDGVKIPVPSQEAYKPVQPGVVYMDGGHNGTPIYFYYGVGSSFYSWNKNMHLQALAILDEDAKKISPVGLQDDFDGYSDRNWLANPIEIKVDDVYGIVHCINTNPNGYEVIYWNYYSPNFSDRYSILNADANNDIPGKKIPTNYRRNGTKGADLAISFDGLKVAVATLHPACNIFLHKGYNSGDVWEDDFYEGLANGSVIALFDTTNSEYGTNISNNDPKPYTEVQVDYDENNNLHVVYDAAYFDVRLDTSKNIPWGNWWNTYSSMVGDSNGVFCDGSVHPKSQLRYWNSITKTHTLLAECEYPKSGEIYKWYNYGCYDSSAGRWGKYINDGPIANIEFFVNRELKAGEPKMVCVWEEMQGDISVLQNSDPWLSPDEYPSLRRDYFTYMKDIKVSVSNDGLDWSTPYNITNTPHKDEGEVSVYHDVIENKIHLVYLEDRLPGSDSNLKETDDYRDKYLQNWPPIDGHFSVPIRKSTTEQVRIVYREFDLSTITSVKSNEKNIPDQFELRQNYPNPFNASTTIEFSIPQKERVVLKIYNIAGQLVATVVDKNLLAGEHRILYNTRKLAGGMYLYVLEAGKFRDIKKMINLR